MKEALVITVTRRSILCHHEARAYGEDPLCLTFLLFLLLLNTFEAGTGPLKDPQLAAKQPVTSR